MPRIYHLLIGFFFCGLFLFNNSVAQNFGDVWLSTGIQSLATKDDGFSLMNYKGNKTYSAVGFVLGKKHRTQWFLGDFSYGLLSNQVGGTLNEMGAGLTMHVFYHKDKPATHGFQWGWANKNTLHVRRHNNFSNYNFRYDYFSAVGPIGRFLLPFQWKNKSFVWQNLANWHLLGVQVKSGYIGAEPENYKKDNSLVKNFFNTVKPFIPLRDLDLGFSSILYWKLPTNNQLGLRYQLNYSKLSGIRDIYRLDQSVELILNVSLW